MSMNKPPAPPALRSFEEQVGDTAAQLLDDFDAGKTGAAVLFVTRDDYGQPRLGVKRSNFIANMVLVGGGAPGAPSFVDQVDQKLDEVTRGVELWEGKGSVQLSMEVNHAHGELVTVTGGKITAKAPQPPLQPVKRRASDGDLLPDRQQALPHVPDNKDGVIHFPKPKKNLN